MNIARILVSVSRWACVHFRNVITFRRGEGETQVTISERKNLFSSMFAFKWCKWNLHTANRQLKRGQCLCSPPRVYGPASRDGLKDWDYTVWRSISHENQTQINERTDTRSGKLKLFVKSVEEPAEAYRWRRSLSQTYSTVDKFIRIDPQLIKSSLQLTKFHKCYSFFFASFSPCYC